MIIQRFFVYFYLFSAYTLQASDTIQDGLTQKLLTHSALVYDVLGHIGTKKMSETFDYVNRQYAAEGGTGKACLENSGDHHKKILGAPCDFDEQKNLTEEQKKLVRSIENRKAYIFFITLPEDIQKRILCYEMGLTNQDAVNKAVGMTGSQLFKVYAYCEHEPLDQLKTIPLEYRFLCSVRQLDHMRHLICHSLLTPDDPHKYFDLEKNEYIPNLYELTAQEKQLIVTLPKQIIENTDLCSSILVAEKQHSVKRGCKTALALALNQGRDFVEDGANYNLCKHVLKGTAIGLSFLLRNHPLVLSPIGSIIFGFFADPEYTAPNHIGNNRCIQKKYILNGRISLMSLTIIGHTIITLLGKLPRLLKPRKIDLIVPAYVSLGMAWDYYKYGRYV